MYRGTTPIIKINVDFDLTSAKSIFLTIWQSGSIIIEKEKDEIEVEADYLQVGFSQEETLQMKAKQVLLMQIRALMEDNNAVASNIMSVNVKDIIKDGVIV